MSQELVFGVLLFVFVLGLIGAVTREIQVVAFVGFGSIALWGVAYLLWLLSGVLV